VHCGICKESLTWLTDTEEDGLWMRPKMDSIEANSLPSILPCSQSTITQSGPDLARALETLAPGNICHRPMAGRVASAKTCLSRLDRNMMESVFTDTTRTRRLIVSIEVDFRCGDPPRCGEKQATQASCFRGVALAAAPPQFALAAQLLLQRPLDKTSTKLPAQVVRAGWATKIWQHGCSWICFAKPPRESGCKSSQLARSM
jgi:hypothetical protein